VWTRKAQVTQQRDGKSVTSAEFKGAIREIEVYPGQSAEWWLYRSPPAALRHQGRGWQDSRRSRQTGEIIID
jgi:hypothetical protein